MEDAQDPSPENRASSAATPANLQLAGNPSDNIHQDNTC
jgi:hypothetical protein